MLEDIFDASLLQEFEKYSQVYWAVNEIIDTPAKLNFLSKSVQENGSWYSLYGCVVEVLILLRQDVQMSAISSKLEEMLECEVDSKIQATVHEMQQMIKVVEDAQVGRSSMSNTQKLKEIVLKCQNLREQILVSTGRVPAKLESCEKKVRFSVPTECNEQQDDMKAQEAKYAQMKKDREDQETKEALDALIALEDQEAQEAHEKKAREAREKKARVFAREAQEARERKAQEAHEKKAREAQDAKDLIKKLKQDNAQLQFDKEQQRKQFEDATAAKTAQTQTLKLLREHLKLVSTVIDTVLRERSE